MARKENKQDKVNDVSSSFNKVEKNEEKQWKEIKIKVDSLTNAKEKIAYLYTQLASYYQNMNSEVLNSSGYILSNYPQLGNLFLDRKINAEIDLIRNLEELKSKDYSYSENIEETPQVLENRTKLLLLDNLGIIEKLKQFETLKNTTELARFLIELFDAEKSTQKRNRADSLRTDLTYLTDKKNDKSPYTKRAVFKSNIILKSFGLPEIPEK